MTYSDALPHFDETMHLTRADLHVLEQEYGYGDLEGAIKGKPDEMSSDKIAKSAVETRLLTY